MLGWLSEVAGLRVGSSFEDRPFGCCATIHNTVHQHGESHTDHHSLAFLFVHESKCRFAIWLRAIFPGRPTRLISPPAIYLQHTPLQSYEPQTDCKAVWTQATAEYKSALGPQSVPWTSKQYSTDLTNACWIAHLSTMKEWAHWKGTLRQSVMRAVLFPKKRSRHSLWPRQNYPLGWQKLLSLFLIAFAI